MRVNARTHTCTHTWSDCVCKFRSKCRIQKEMCADANYQIDKCGLDSQSWAGFWKNDRAVRTIKYNNLLFIILYNIYNLLFIRLAVITHNWIVIRHPVSIFFIFTIVLPQNVIFGSVQIIVYVTLLERSADNALRDDFPCSRHPPRDFWRRLKEMCGLEPRTNFFSFKKSAKTSAD